jgi:hypothetical protein
MDGRHLTGTNKGTKVAGRNGDRLWNSERRSMGKSRRV